MESLCVLDKPASPTIFIGSVSPIGKGMSDPITFIDELKGLPDEDIRKVMSTNMQELMGLKVDA